MSTYNPVDAVYHDVMRDIQTNGVVKGDRTGTGTLSTFGQMMRFDLTDGKLPLITARKIFHRSFIHETLWFLSGSTDIEYLKANNVSIWDDWVKPGTERYRDLTEEEIKSALKKKYGVPALLLAGIDGSDKSSDVEVTPELFMLDDVPHMKIHVMMPEEWVAKVRENPSELEIAIWQQGYRQIFGKEPKVLSGGSIGTGAYGSQWRAWEDTRLIRDDEIETYLERGFALEADGLKGGRAVVHRTIDQIANAIELIKHTPDSRRILVVAFNPAKVEDCMLPPCHSVWQLWTRELSIYERNVWVTENASDDVVKSLGLLLASVMELPAEESDPLITEWHDTNNTPKRALSCMLYARSQDFCVGTAFNIAQYGVLTNMIAQVTNTVAEEFVWVGGDCHIYNDHVDVAIEQQELPYYENSARLKLNPEVRNIDDFTFDDISIENYEHGPVLKYPIAV